MDTMNCLPFESICNIIKTCGESGVKNIELKSSNFNLRLSFQAKFEQGQENPCYQSLGQVTAIQDNINSLIKQDEHNLKQVELEEIRIQDPFKYERMILEHELES